VPSASEFQFIDKARVELARKRTQVALPDEPLVAGFDVSGGGKAWNVIRFRRGFNGSPYGLMICSRPSSSFNVNAEVVPLAHSCT